MTDQEFAALIELGAEQRNVEFKGPGTISDKHLVHRVARAILGMTNRRDGGYVIVGVNESNGILDLVGLDATMIGQWSRDALADKVAPLVDPSVDFDLEHRTYDGRQFTLVTVREFDETPVFCRVTRNDASNNIVLREGALYVRGRRKPESVEIRTSQEMRDLLELSLRKRIQSLAPLFAELTQASLSQVAISAPPTPTDQERFDAQLRELGI